MLEQGEGFRRALCWECENQAPQDPFELHVVLSLSSENSANILTDGSDHADPDL